MTSVSSTSAASSIVKTLGSGSGLDISALVEALVAAQFAAKTAQLNAKADTNTARISSASELKSGIQGFATALTSLVGGGTLQPAATSSDTAIVTAATIPGQTPPSTATTVRVRALAAAQTSHLKTAIANPATSQGTGTLSIRFGTATVNTSGAMTAFTNGAAPAIAIRIDPADSSLTGIAAKINAANTGVVASVVTDATGSRLALTGPSGAASAFTVTVTEDASARGLAKFAVGVNQTNTTTPQAAINASVDINGVTTTRTSNVLTDAIPGVRLDLQSVNTTKVVTIGAARQTDNLKAAVTDTVATFNELKKSLATATDAATGSLRGDPAARALTRSLAQLATRQLIPAGAAGAPRSLAELGVRTNRDGTLSVDDATLTRMLSQHPAAVEAIFAASKGTGASGLSEALNSIALTATSSITGLGASVAQYNRTTTSLSDERAAVSLATERLRTRLTGQFAAMDSRVAAYKSTQSFLENQIKAWNQD